MGAPRNLAAFRGPSRPSGKTFREPTGKEASAKEKRKLPWDLREPATDVHIIPGAHTTLVSLCKFADAGYVTVLDKESAKIYDGEKAIIKVTEEAILKAYRGKSGLWRIPLKHNVVNENTDTVIWARPEEQEYAAHVFELPSAKETIRYMHAAAGFPQKDTWLRAIRAGNFATWPGVSVSAVQKHFPESEETQKGHMKSVRQGLRTTKDKIDKTLRDSEKQEPIPRKQDIFVTTVDLQETIYTDQTGKFPYVSSRGNRYIMVALHIDANAIYVEPMRTRAKENFVDTYEKVVSQMRTDGLKIKKQVLDNEASEEYKNAIKEKGIEYELVPPGQHRRNIAERAIQTFKSHFIAILCGVDDAFPLHLWCRLLPQAELTVNMLRQSNVTPKISAFAHVHGVHNFMRKPFAPMGCAVMAHIKPDKQGSWDPRAIKAWHVGTSMEHHRCFIVYSPATKATRIADTVFFKHRYITVPRYTPEDAVVAAAKQLTQAVKGMVPQESEQEQSLKSLSDLFQRIAEKRRQQADETNNNQARFQVRPVEQRSNNNASGPRVVEDDEETVRTSNRTVDREPIRPPRVGQAKGLIVACPPAQIDTLPKTPPPSQPQRPHLIPPDDEDDEDELQPAPNEATIHPEDRDDPPIGHRYPTRSRTAQVLLACMELHLSTLSPKTLAGRKLPMQLWCDMAGAVMDINGDLLEYRHLIRRPEYKDEWSLQYGNEVGRLAQGMPDRVEGTDTIFFIHKKDVPVERRKDTTYVRVVCDVRPHKENPNRVRITAGGDQINYPWECSTPTADLTTVKLLLNSVISTKGARFFTMDIKDFYLNTPLKRYEYLRFPIKDIPEDVIQQYLLNEKATADGFVFVEVRKGMYGLPQAGLLAQELLEERLGKQGYFQSKLTPGLWMHRTRPIQFTLVVDDFGVKYVGEENKQHLINALQSHYRIDIDHEGSKYCGLNLTWDYPQRCVHVSMPGYVKRALVRFQHEIPKRRQDQPYPHEPPRYGAKQQFAKKSEDSPLLDIKEKKFIQQVTGTFLFYARAVDPPMLTALSALASEQARPTEKTMQRCKQFLDYAASQDEAAITFHASDMILAGHSDASYLSELYARSRAGGHWFLSKDVMYPPNNGAIHNLSHVIKAVMGSAAEAEIGALYHNCKLAVPWRATLEELGHPQPKTPVQTDNSTAHGLLTNRIAPKALKAMDMHFHWLRDREAQRMFRYYWRAGPTNRADYYSKHHPPKHHRTMRPEFVTALKYLKKVKDAASRYAVASKLLARVC